MNIDESLIIYFIQYTDINFNQLMSNSQVWIL